MIRTLAILQDGTVRYDLSLKELKRTNILWFWVDFEKPEEKETRILSRFFHFHPLAIEDCLEFVQRPKIDFYDTYVFIVLHAIQQKTLQAEEVDMFVSATYIVTFHKKPIRDINNIWHQVKKDERLRQGPIQIMHKITDKLVDDYFPPIYRLEDVLNNIEENTKNETIDDLMKQIFAVRSDLYKIRRTIIPMRDLLYRIITSERVNQINESIYFHDIYDHLMKLVEMIDANRELTADIRDSYLSFTSNRMNTIMMTLTVISSIFMPLTFIAGIYGMNFEHMPELKMEYGYYIVLAVMAFIAIGMVFFFYRMGWFRFNKGPKL